jgi:hypothetical protein
VRGDARKLFPVSIRKSTARRRGRAVRGCAHSLAHPNQPTPIRSFLIESASARSDKGRLWKIFLNRTKTTQGGHFAPRAGDARGIFDILCARIGKSARHAKSQSL